jgi:hypothetical protein
MGSGMGSGLIKQKCLEVEMKSKPGVRLYRVTTLKGRSSVQIAQLWQSLTPWQGLTPLPDPIDIDLSNPNQMN